MLGWNSLYEEPAVLAQDWGHHRIYAAQSYAGIRDRMDAPAVLSEAEALAPFFPLCWQLIEGEPILLALLSLLPAGRGHYPTGRTTMLPLCLQAYPFAIPDPHAIERQQLVVDRVIPDAPTDVGAPIMLETGRMSRGALVRAKTALQVARGVNATNALSRSLYVSGFMESWPLRFDLGHGQIAQRSDLMVISAASLKDQSLFDLVGRHGPEAGLFLGFHRISLFRIGVLMQLAKAAVARSVPESGAA